MDTTAELDALRKFADRFDEITIEVTNRGTSARPTVKQLNELVDLFCAAKRLRAA